MAFVTKRVEYSRPEVCFGGDSGLLNPKVAQKCAWTTDTVVHTSRANGQCLELAGPTCAQCASALKLHAEIIRPQHNREHALPKSKVEEPDGEEPCRDTHQPQKGGCAI
jgi:hypothetical protein